MKISLRIICCMVLALPAAPLAAAGHLTLVPALREALSKEGRSDIKVIAGGVIPPQDYDYLRDAGVQGIYGPGRGARVTQKANSVTMGIWSEGLSQSRQASWTVWLTACSRRDGDAHM